MSEPGLVLLPWVRRGGPVDLPPDPRDAGHPASSVASTAEVRVNGAGPATVAFRLLGPGDVTGLAPQQVIRTDPAPGARTFESNYLVQVELDEPALPWLFTPASAADGRLRPWLCLVVVREQPGVQLLPPGRGGLPVLRVGGAARPEDELPDLDESWAWAHAQLAGDPPSGDAALAGALAADPERSLARLVSPRLLAEQTPYLACVVPTFEAGRRAGLGDDPAGAEGPAWRLAPGMGPVDLPVLHHWRFATGPAGDFQSLALAIRGRPVADGFGTRPVDLSTSGLGVAGADDVQVRLAGALLALGPRAEPWSDPAMADRFADALTQVLDAPDDAPAGAPLLAPPRYGSTYAPAPRLDPARPGRWYETLNRDPAHRVAAALGTLVVQEQQETLVAAAWDQAADLRTAGRVLGLATLGLAVAQSMHRRHVAPLAPEAGLFVLAPLRARLLAAAPAGTGASFAQQWALARLPDRALSPVVRRATRPRGPAVRRRRGGTPSARLDVLGRMTPAVRIGRELAPAAGPLTFEGGGASLPTPVEASWARVSAAAVTNAPPRPGFEIAPAPVPTPGPGPLPPVVGGGVLDPGRIGPVLGGRAVPLARRRPGDPGDPTDPGPVDPVDPDPVDPDPVDPRPPRRDSAAAALFRTVAARQLAAVLGPPPPDRPALGVLASREVFDEAVALTAPGRTFAARVAGLLEDPVPTGPGGPAPGDVVPALRFAPRFDAPMSRALVELGQHWLLPGLDGVPANTALALRTNGAFVDAFMVGLNHELGRELLWREYPTPLTATFFDRFWDAAVDPEAPPDVAPLDAWGDRGLGEPTATAPGGDRFVLLLRSELVRRFPDALVSATRPGPPAEHLLPVFRGSMEPDVTFFGFTVPLAEAADWSVVIAEQPGAPRFGFEVGEAPAGVTHAPATEATSARQAARLRQLPARLTIPVSVLLRPA